MEKRLCYCNSCRSFYIIDPGKTCPKCGRTLVSSVVTETEWDKSTSQQRNAYKSSLGSVADTRSTSAGDTGRSSQSRQSGMGDMGRTSGARQSGTGAGSQSYDQNPAGQAADIEKKLKSYKNWSIVIAIIGIVSFFSLIGQVSQLEAQGYVVTNKTPLYIACAFSIFCAFAGFYGKSVYKQSSRLNNSWAFFVIVLLGMAVLGIAYQIMPGWLCVVGCAVNAYNGYKLKKLLS